MLEHWFVAFIVATSVLLAPFAGVAHAETGPPNGADTERAKQVFNEAMADLEAQKYAEACLKLEQVTELMPKGIGAHQMLGECYEKLGRLGSTLEQFQLAQTLALAASDPRIDELTPKVKQLEAHVSHLTIVVPQTLRTMPALSITHNGRAVESSAWDTEQVIDKGSHVVEAHAAGFLPWKQEIDIALDGGKHTIYMPSQLIPVQQSSPPVRPGTPWLKPLGWSLVGMGATSGATAGILTWFALRQQSSSVASGHCDASYRCDAQGVIMQNKAHELMQGAMATAVVGGVLGIGGITLLIAAPKNQEDAARKTSGLTWNATVMPQGFSLQGSW